MNGWESLQNFPYDEIMKITHLADFILLTTSNHDKDVDGRVMAKSFSSGTNLVFHTLKHFRFSFTCFNDIVRNKRVSVYPCCLSASEPHPD